MKQNQHIVINSCHKYMFHIYFLFVPRKRKMVKKSGCDIKCRRQEVKVLLFTDMSFLRTRHYFSDFWWYYTPRKLYSDSRLRNVKDNKLNKNKKERKFHKFQSTLVLGKYIFWFETESLNINYKMRLLHTFGGNGISTWC